MALSASVAAKLRTFSCTPNKTLLALVAGTLTRPLRDYSLMLAPQSLALCDSGYSWIEILKSPRWILVTELTNQTRQSFFSSVYSMAYACPRLQNSFNVAFLVRHAIIHCTASVFFVVVLLLL